MTKEKYLDMREQLGKDPNIDECPPGAEDLPEIVIDSINIFNMLGDRVYPDIGYIGKDYTNLPVLLQVYEIDNVELALLTLSKLDSHAIKQAQDKMKRERDKIKRKSSGR